LKVECQYYVFHDESFALSWIDAETAIRMAEYFAKNGFEIVGVNELVKVVNQGIRNPGINVTIVFCHDVIPDKLTDNPHSPTQNSLFRRFLNAGHTIIGMGDEPGWYVGIGREKKPLPQPQSIQNLTGLTKPTRLDEKLVLVEPTVEGLLFNIESWKGMRPRPSVGRDGFTMIPLAVSKEGVHGYIWTHHIRRISGLIRLYDLHLTSEAFTADMLKCVLNLALKRTVWDELTSLCEKFDLLRQEVEDKLTNKLDLIIQEVKKRKNESQAQVRNEDQVYEHDKWKQNRKTNLK